MIVKVVEIRDAATFIPALVIKVDPENEGQRYLIRRAGYSVASDTRNIVLMRLTDNEASYDPYHWGNRTMQQAHIWLVSHGNFDEVQDGDVIDVEFILGETSKPKESERYEEMA